MAFGRATIGDYFINIVPSMDGVGGKVRSGVQSSGIGRIFETTIGVALGNALGSAQLACREIGYEGCLLDLGGIVTFGIAFGVVGIHT